MAFRTLISSDVLAGHLADPAYVIVDCRFKLDDVEWGAREYEAGHIPGATYANLDRDLSGTKTGTNGRHPLPDPEALTVTFGRMGIASGVQVVAYDQDAGSYASRLWWLLRWMGHESVAVLDGGFKKWKAEGKPTAGGAESRRPRTFLGSPRPEMTASLDEVSNRVGAPNWRLVDARAPERYAGISEPVDRVGGHIPSAVDHFFQRNLDESGLFRTPATLRQQFHASVGSTPPDHVICYCGSGVTACHNLLALEHAGLTGARLYPGSWSEWSADPSRPIEKGNGTSDT